MKEKVIGWIAIIYGFIIGYYFLGVVYLDLFNPLDLTNDFTYLLFLVYCLCYLIPALLLIYFGSKFKKKKK